jgi:hypothetical protein
MEGIFFAGPGALILKLVDEAAFAHDVLSDMLTICGAFSNAVDSGRRRKAYAQRRPRGRSSSFGRRSPTNPLNEPATRVAQSGKRTPLSHDRQKPAASEARTALKLLERRPLQPTALSLSWYLILIGL